MTNTTVLIRAAAAYLSTLLVWAVLYPMVSSAWLWVVTVVAALAFLATGGYVWLETAEDDAPIPSAVRARIAEVTKRRESEGTR